MVEVFKTNVQKKKQSQKLLTALREAFPSSKVNIDLTDCDKVLRIEGEQLESPSIMILVKKHGFKCEALE
jgi:hypothetical protein